MAFVGVAEPDVTLTDYGLALERGVFAVLLYRLRESAGPARTRFIVFFAALATAALAVGTVHGFHYHGSTLAGRVARNATLIAIVVAALSAWMIGSRVEPARPAGFILRCIATVVFIGCCVVVVLMVRNSFAVAVIHSLPAVFFLIFVLSRSYLRSRRRYLLIGIIGLALTLVGAGHATAGDCATSGLLRP